MVESLRLRFMGVGNAKASELGSASAVLEIGGRPSLLIDCGPRTLDDFARYYGMALPPAVYLTHLHLDHIGGVEQLFYRAYFAGGAPLRLMAPATLVPALHDKLAASPFVLSEGGANFWDAFQLIPASGHFWLGNLLFDVFPVRHSGYRGAYGLGLRGSFLYSGDTRPIPEIVGEFASTNERIFHDCAEVGSPAHTGIEDLLREYPEHVRNRMVAYHYESTEAAGRLERAGLTVARAGEVFELPAPCPVAAP